MRLGAARARRAPARLARAPARGPARARRAVVRAALAALSAGLVAAPAGGAASGTTPLRELAGAATVVVLGSVETSEDLDAGGLRRHRVRVARALRGTPPAALLEVVEIRGAVAMPPLVTPGSRVVLLLQPAPAYSYLDQHLPAGERFMVAGGRDGVVALGGADDEAEVGKLVAEALALGPAAEAPARRAYAFAALASGNERLVADGIAELTRLPEIGALAEGEQRALAQMLADAAVPLTHRTAVATLLGARQVRDALPALRGAGDAAEPTLLAAVLTARARLGAPAGGAELQPLLDDPRPAVRAAAVRALAWTPGAEALAEIERRATGDELAVRRAAVAALADARRADAIPVLRRTFESADRELKQASARALRAIGGAAVDDALVELALHGTSGETRRYAAMLLLTTHPRDHPAVRRLEAGDPSPEVRDALEHGFETRHRHEH